MVGNLNGMQQQRVHQSTQVSNQTNHTKPQHPNSSQLELLLGSSNSRAVKQILGPQQQSLQQMQFMLQQIQAQQTALQNKAQGIKPFPQLQQSDANSYHAPGGANQSQLPISSTSFPGQSIPNLSQVQMMMQPRQMQQFAAMVGRDGNVGQSSFFAGTDSSGSKPQGG
jgi:hypothetical protein